MSIESVLANWDGQLSCSRFDESTGAFFTIAIHSRSLGPAAGGTRATTYTTHSAAVEDATRLASAMTLKMAVADLPMGGGKSVIALPMQRKEMTSKHWQAVLQIHAENLAALNGSYWTGPDVGTSSNDMDALYAASRSAFGRSAAAGGPGSSAPETAHGVYVALRAAAREAGIADLNNQRVLVQGLGAVGMDVARRVATDGAQLIAADVDVKQCEAAKTELGARIIDVSDVLAAKSDVFVPCAMGGIINDAAAASIATRVIAGAANNLLTHAGAADVLHQRGITLAPDFVANGGGAIHLVGREVLGWSPETVSKKVEQIGSTLEDVFSLARSDGVSTDRAARRLATLRLETSLRRR